VPLRARAVGPGKLGPSFQHCSAHMQRPSTLNILRHAAYILSAGIYPILRSIDIYNLPSPSNSTTPDSNAWLAWPSGVGPSAFLPGFVTEDSPHHLLHPHRSLHAAAEASNRAWPTHSTPLSSDHSSAVSEAEPTARSRQGEVMQHVDMERREGAAARRASLESLPSMGAASAASHQAAGASRSDGRGHGHVTKEDGADDKRWGGGDHSHTDDDNGHGGDKVHRHHEDDGSHSNHKKEHAEHQLLSTAMRLGTVFSPTDNLAILHYLSPNTQPVLHSLLFGEGVMNDITAVIMLRTTANITAVTWDEVAWSYWNFVTLFCMSSIMGVSAGLLSALLTKRAPRARGCSHAAV
jgi:hypothetical protein